MTRGKRPRIGWLHFFLFAVITATPAALFAQAGFAQTGNADLNNIFPLAPRELRQRLTRAQAAVEEQRFSDAVAEIGEVLNNTGSDDFFLGVPGSADAQVSLKTEALALLGAMPVKGRKMYELQYGADAKVALEHALESNDLTQLTEVSRRYFQTKAGYEATLILGRCQLDQGRPLAAALTLKRVADVPTALSQYDPELSVLLATCWLHANQPTEAKQTLLGLKSRSPQAKVRLVDREVGLFDREANALTWLQAIVGGSRISLSTAATQWAHYRGDEKRNAQSSSGTPLLNYNWKLPTANDPADLGRINQIYQKLRNSDEPLVCALQPLVVQNYAVVRQPESDKLIGINLTNGKRTWIYPPFDDSLPAQQARQVLSARGGPQSSSREQTLKQRIWDDNAFGQVSSDGRQVYLIDELAAAPIQGVNMPNNLIGPRGARIPNPSSPRATNSLVALDLIKQGSLVWTVGGATGDNPALAGAFFLGAPLPVGDQLYALAEFTGEIRLVCLDARTGNLEWKQPLASIEEPQIANDSNRRLSAASPSLGDGILICPTSAGAVVAVDLTTRTLRWGYQYKRTDLNGMQRGAGFRQQFMPQMSNVPLARWIDATATIADGCVILTPPESNQLHCLDLLSGKARWSPVSREDMLFVACVHKGKIILVGRNRVRAINLADGKPAWSAALQLENEVTVGRGYYSDSNYFLPISGQQICKIDLDAGSIVSRAQTEAELGNLVCYQDQLISMSPQSVTSFVLFSERLEKQLEQRLAANPQDIDALAIKAQILLQENNANESLAVLRRAAALAPDRTTISDLLVKVMMVLVRNDLTAHVGLTDELNKLLTDANQRREMLRWRVQGLTEQSRLDDALSSLLELADQELATAATATPTTALIPFERERNVRIDRWLQGQLRQIVSKADSPLQARIATELKTRLERASAIGGVHVLRAFLNLFGFHESADAARLVLIQRLIAADALLEAEVLAGDMLPRSEAGLAGSARALLAALYEKAKRPELAARYYEELDRDFADITVRGSKTGSQIATDAKSNPTLQPYFAGWPSGEVVVTKTDSVSMSQRNAYPVFATHYYGAAPRGLRVSFDPNGSNILSVRSETGQILGAAPLGNNVRPNGMGGVSGLTAKLNGHLVVANLGADVVAVDGLRPDRGTDAFLWRQDLGQDAVNNNFNNGFSRNINNANPLTGPQPDTSGRLRQSTGPLTSGGVCFQRGRQIICVDPLTGQSLWERASIPQAEIPQQAHLFGDDELLFVADAKIDSKQDEALVLSAVDGQFLGKRKVEQPDRRWATHGRRVLGIEVSNSIVNLRLYDAWEPTTPLWTKRLASGSRGFLIESEELALLEASGQFTLISLADGKLRYSVPLEAEPSLTWIQVIRSRDQYLLLASQESTATNSALNMGQSVPQRSMHGHTYAFDRATGKLQWQSPAFISHHALPVDQPTESPLLMFVASRHSNNKLATSVLVLDRRTGRNVYEEDLAGSFNASDIFADPAKHTATITLFGQPNRSIYFQMTANPLAPEPPAQTGEMASAAANRRAGNVDITLGDAIELLRNSPRNLFPPAPGAPIILPPPARPR